MRSHLSFESIRAKPTPRGCWLPSRRMRVEITVPYAESMASKSASCMYAGRFAIYKLVGSCSCCCRPQNHGRCKKVPTKAILARKGKRREVKLARASNRGARSSRNLSKSTAKAFKSQPGKFGRGEQETWSMKDFKHLKWHSYRGNSAKASKGKNLSDWNESQCLPPALEEGEREEKKRKEKKTTKQKHVKIGRCSCRQKAK